MWLKAKICILLRRLALDGDVLILWMQNQVWKNNKKGTQCSLLSEIQQQYICSNYLTIVFYSIS